MTFTLFLARRRVENYNNQTMQSNKYIKDEKMPKYSCDFKNPKVVLLSVADTSPSSGYNMNMTLLLTTGKLTNTSRNPSVSFRFQPADFILCQVSNPIYTDFSTSVMRSVSATGTRLGGRKYL